MKSLRTTFYLALVLLLSGFWATVAQGQDCNLPGEGPSRITGISNPVVSETAGTATFVVTCDCPTRVNATIYYRLNDGTATAGSDYVDQGGPTTNFVVVGGTGTETYNIVATILDDNDFEPDETFDLELIIGFVGEQASPSVGPPCFFIDDQFGTATIQSEDPANQPPVADAGPDQTLECTSPGGTSATLNGSGSSDPDSDPLTYTWTGPFGTATGVGPTVTLAKGTHTITLTVEDDDGATDTDQVVITVQDTTPPVVTLNGPNSTTLECPAPYVELGATATDACDGSVSVVTTGTVDASMPGTYTVSYKATDASGNMTTATRTVNVVDTTPPVITLNGPNPMTLECAVDAYVEPGAVVTDTCDPSPSLVITGTVDVSTPGTYTVSYKATDASGNMTTATRTVNVVDTTPPVITLAAGPIELWPPNHAYHTIGLASIVTGASDLCDLDVGADDVVTSSAHSDEVEDATGGGDGHTKNDILIAGDCRSVDLRAERQGSGNGRVYTLDLAVADASGNVGTAAFGVHVRKAPPFPAVDDGPAYTVPGCTPAAAARVASAGEVEATAGEQALALAEGGEAQPLQPAGVAEATPDAFVLEPNYPNPFNPQTTIRFGVPRASQVSLVVYDLLGREVKRLVEGTVEAGMHAATFEARSLPSGWYVYRLDTPEGSFTQTMLLLK